MSNRKFLKQLELMKGKTFQYGNQIHCLNEYKIDEQHEKVTIVTNLKTFERPYDSAEEFLKHWQPVNNVGEVADIEDQNKKVAIYTESENSLMDSLIATLQQNITKVQADKNYIPQATSINNNVNTIVNITKMKLDLFKQMKRAKTT